MRATSFFFTPSPNVVNSLTSSNDELSKEAKVPATGMAVSTKGGGESKDGNTVVADTGMKESQSEEDNSSDLESFGKPDSPELPEGAEESLDNVNININIDLLISYKVYVCSFCPPLIGLLVLSPWSHRRLEPPLDLHQEGRLS